MHFFLSLIYLGNIQTMVFFVNHYLAKMTNNLFKTQLATNVV